MAVSKKKLKNFLQNLKSSFLCFSTDWEAEKLAEYEARQAKVISKNEHFERFFFLMGFVFQAAKVLPRGRVLKLTGLPPGTVRDSIKKAFDDSSANVAFVDVNQDNSAYVRLRGEIDAKAVLAKLEETGKVKVGDTLVDVAVLDGEEEDAFLKKGEEARNNAAAAFKENREGGRDGKRAGSPARGGGQKMARTNHD